MMCTINHDPNGLFLLYYLFGLFSSFSVGCWVAAAQSPDSKKKLISLILQNVCCKVNVQLPRYYVHKLAENDDSWNMTQSCYNCNNFFLLLSNLNRFPHNLKA